MKVSRFFVVLLACSGLANAAIAQQDEVEISIEVELATRFAQLALDCVHREYPNKISHVLNNAADTRTPSSLYPVFYGCFDWHSSVHGHWLLVRLLHAMPEEAFPAGFRDQMIAALGQSFTTAGVAAEVEYFQAENRNSFERPYGIAWFLQLTAELRQWQDPLADVWLEILQPLEAVIVAQIKAWLPNLAYPIRLGTHNQSMFAFGLILDWSRTAGDFEMTELITERSLAFHVQDKNCPLDYEPSGEDFLSPCLMEADLMRRVLERDQYATWLAGFLPGIPVEGRGDWLATGIVKDPTDGKLVHLDGVNLSRAWNMENIAGYLPPGDPRKASLLASSKLHTQTGIASVSAENYAGSHWLASFAIYLLTHRGQMDDPIFPSTRTD